MNLWKNKFEHIIDKLLLSAFLVLLIIIIESLVFMLTKNVYCALAIAIIVVSIVLDFLKK